MSTFLSKTPIYPELYGAKGDGSTDDTTAITSALTAAGTNGVVVLSRGKTYKTTSQITIPADYQTIEGYGATITSTNDTQWGKFTITRPGIKLLGIKFSCLYATVSPQTYATVDIGGGASDVVVCDCDLNDTPMGIRVVGTAIRVTIDRNRFYKNFCGVVVDDDTVNQPSFVSITNNTFRTGLGTTTTSLSGAIKVSGLAGDVHNVISNNRIDTAGQVGIEVQGPDQFLVSDNSIYNVGFGVSVSESDNATVTGNSVKLCAAIGLEVASNSNNVVLSGNIVKCTTGGVYAIAISSSSKSVVVSGNRLHSIAECIYIQPTGNVQITGNYLSGSSCVYCHDCSHVSVIGNTFDGDGVNTFAAFFVDASDNDISGFVFSDNRVLGGFPNSVIFLYSPNAHVISDMIVSGNNIKGCDCAGQAWNPSMTSIAVSTKYIRSFNNVGEGTNSFNKNLTVPFWDLSSNQTWPYGYFFLERCVVRMDATGGARSFALPAPATVGSGYQITVMKSDSSGNAVTVTTGTGSIKGVSSLASQYKQACYMSDGTDWTVISSN